MVGVARPCQWLLILPAEPRHQAASLRNSIIFQPLSCLTAGFPLIWWAFSSHGAYGNGISSKTANLSRRSFDPTTVTLWAHAKPDDSESREKDMSVWFRLNRQSCRK